MGINGVGSFYAQNYDVQNRGRSTRGKSSVDDFACIGNATSLSESSDNGKRIGITTVGDRGYIAMYADSSTEQDPIIKVGDYEVRVKDVDPNNATKMEMFALMSYMDDKGLTNNQGMKSFNKMTAFASQAEYNGYCSGISDENAAWTIERNWLGILGSAKDTFWGNAQTYKQGLECQKIIDNLEKWNEGHRYSDTDVGDNIPKNVQKVFIGNVGDGATVSEGSMDFSRFAPNASKEVIQAFVKAAEETGYYEGKRMDYISQVLVHQVENRQKGVANYSDVFGGSIASALRAAREILYNLENPLMPASQRGEKSAQYVEQEKEFYKAFIEKLEGLTRIEDTEETVDYAKILEEKINEIYEKIQNGDTEAVYQIGAQAFTEKEWDKLLSEVDDITEEMREAMREEYQKRLEKVIQETSVEISNEEITGFVEETDNVDIVSKLLNTGNSKVKVSNFKEYETPNYKFVPEPEIGEGGMRIYKNGQSVAVFSVDDLKIRVDEQTGTRVLISEMGGYGGAWYDAIPVDAELENGLAEAIGVDDLEEVSLEGYYIGTHTGTGIQYVMRQGDEGRGGKVLLRNAADEAKYNALAEEYYNRYPNLVTSQESGRIYASFEICGMMERTETGFVRIGFDNISYNDNFDYKKNWSAKLTGDTWDLLNEWLKENRESMKEWGKFSSWKDVFDQIGGSYERVWSDEEWKQGYLNN